MAKDNITRRILIDEPSREDLFHGKGHARTAQALVDTIRTFQTEDRAVGLDGPWGSGKSSVVEIAAQALKTNKDSKTNFYFFTFDIWAGTNQTYRSVA